MRLVTAAKEEARVPAVAPVVADHRPKLARYCGVVTGRSRSLTGQAQEQSGPRTGLLLLRGKLDTCSHPDDRLLTDGDAAVSVAGDAFRSGRRSVLNGVQGHTD